MAQQFQSSFIPKGSITDVQPAKKPAGTVGVLSFTLFIASIIASVGIYFYKGMLKNDVESLQMQLVDAGRTIDKETISKMVDFSRKLGATREILEKHSAVSGFLKSLSSSTVSSVFFTDFSYEDLKQGILTVNLKGRADSYGTVALQESVFTKNQYWNSVTFSNLRLAEEGAVDFDVSIAVDSKISLYNPDIPNQQSNNSSNSNDLSQDLVDSESFNIDDIEADLNNI